MLLRDWLGERAAFVNCCHGSRVAVAALFLFLKVRRLMLCRFCGGCGGICRAASVYFIYFSGL